MSSATATTATASSNITIKLLTGDLMVLEVRSEETYQSLYRLIKEALPEEIRPESVNQMNLLLDGDLVPLTSAPVLSEGEYLLVLDAYRYRVRLSPTPYHAFDLTMDGPDRDVYEFIHLVVDKKSRQDTERGIYSSRLLFHTERKRYYGLDGIELEWAEGLNYEDELGVYLPQEKVGYTQGEMVTYLMSKMEHLCPSMAMARAMRTELKEEMRMLDAYYPSWEDSLRYGEEEEEEEEEKEQEQHWT